jgi:hypothetical protein
VTLFVVVDEVEPVAAVVVVAAVLVVVNKVGAAPHLQRAGIELHGQYS